MSCATLPALCDGKRFTVPLLAVTSPQVKPDCDRAGYTARIEAAGGHVLSGMCFYQSYAREIAEANGWKRLATNSAKLVNILGGYGYRPMLASMEACVDAAARRQAEAGMTVFRARQAMGRTVRGPALVAKRRVLGALRSRPRRRRVLPAGAQARRPILCGKDSRARHREGRRRDRLDAARDDVARRRAARAGVELGESDPGAGRGTRRRADARRLRADITAAIPNGVQVEVNPAQGTITVIG